MFRMRHYNILIDVAWVEPVLNKKENKALHSGMVV